MSTKWLDVIVSLWLLSSFCGGQPLPPDDPRIDLPSSVTIHELGVLSVDCYVNETRVAYRWSKVGSPEFEQSGGELRIEGVLVSNAGVYVCHIALPTSCPPSYSCQAAVEVKVEFQPRPDPLKVTKFAADLRQSVDLQCAVRAFPAVTFSWNFTSSRGSRQTLNSLNARSTSYTSTYTIADVTDNTYGTYLCTAVNKAGKGTVNIVLQRPGKPDPPMECTLLNTTSMSAVMTCIPGFAGGETCTFPVEKSGSLIRPQPAKSTFRYTNDGMVEISVTELYPNTSYVLKVYAENLHGKSEESFGVNAVTNEGIYIPPTMDKSTTPVVVIIGAAVGGSVALILLILIIFGLVACSRKQTRKQKPSGSNAVDKPQEQRIVIAPATENKTNKKIENKNSFNRKNDLRSSSRSDYGFRNSFKRSGSRRSSRRKREKRISSAEYGGVPYNPHDRSPQNNPAFIHLQGFDGGETSDDNWGYQNRAYSRDTLETSADDPANNRYSGGLRGSRPPSYYDLKAAKTNALQSAQNMSEQQPTLAGMGALSALPILSPLGRHPAMNNLDRDTYNDSHLSRSPTNIPINNSVNAPGLPPRNPPPYENPLISPINAHQEPAHEMHNLKSSPPHAHGHTSPEPPVPLVPSKKVGSNYSLPDELWEFPREKLVLRQKIGDGLVGEVWRGRAEGIFGRPGQTVVAVKMLKEGFSHEERRAMMREMNVMKMLQPHPNIIALYGTCTEREPNYIIMEYASKGNLQTLLRSYRLPWTDESPEKYSPYANMPPVRKLTARDLFIFALQVATGMEYISSKELLHRDLAARNVLVTDDYSCKISDFGFARDVAQSRQYESRTQSRLPIRWMAPESLFDCMYSTKSDVWAFGVLLWEIVTLGSSPYPGVGGSDVMDLIQRGFVMDKPRLCTDELYLLMRECWRSDPRHRPSFAEIQVRIEDMLAAPTQLDIFVDQMVDNFYEILEDLPGEKC